MCSCTKYLKDHPFLFLCQLAPSLFPPISSFLWAIQLRVMQHLSRAGPLGSDAASPVAAGCRLTCAQCCQFLVFSMSNFVFRWNLKYPDTGNSDNRPRGGAAPQVLKAPGRRTSPHVRLPSSPIVLSSQRQSLRVVQETAMGTWRVRRELTSTLALHHFLQWPVSCA